MLYFVECSFADPGSEAEWNDFYSQQKLPALISVSGFSTSQRFRAMHGGCPEYLAVHTIDSVAVLQGEEYRHKGGGNFSRWQPYITDWRRNIYTGIAVASGVRNNEFLLFSESGPEPLLNAGVSPEGLQAIALDQFPMQRWVAVVSEGVADIQNLLSQGVFCYQPITDQLTPLGVSA